MDNEKTCLLRSNELGWMRGVICPLGWALAFLGELGDVWTREEERGGCKSWRRELGNLRGQPPAAVTAAEGIGPDLLYCCCS